MALFVPDHVHLLATVFLSGGSPRLTEEFVDEWLRALVEVAGMSMLADPLVRECSDKGNEGVTGAVLLKDSHATIHAWDHVHQPYAQVDLYSCRRFKVKEVVDFTMSWLKPVGMSYVLIDRNHGEMKTIEKNWALRPTR